MTTFFGKLCVHFQTLLRWECPNVCHDLEAKRESIYIQKWEYENRSRYTIDL